MNCFPMMIPLEGKRVVLVGGGNVALRKAEKLRLFGAKIAVCAPVVLPALAALADEKHARYQKDLRFGAAFVVAATDDRALNAAVAEDCNRLGIPVNSVDAPAECSFYFPAVITEGNVTGAVSTGGAAPALAAALKRCIASRLPENLNEICKRAEALRGTMPAEEYAAAVQKLLEDES